MLYMLIQLRARPTPSSADAEASALIAIGGGQGCARLADKRRTSKLSKHKLAHAEGRCASAAAPATCHLNAFRFACHPAGDASARKEEA